VNQVGSPEVAFDVIDRLQQTTRMFLQHDWHAAGYIPQDRELETMFESKPDSPAATELHHLVTHWWNSTGVLRTPSNSFLKRLDQRQDQPVTLMRTA
jgi:hypothetical protein